MTKALADAPPSPDDKIALFAGIVGKEYARASDDLRREFSQDLIDWEASARVALVVSPANTNEVAAVVKLAGQLNLAITVRGAGLSYTGGYLPQADETVAIDLTRLDEITALSEDDQYITVGAGATWQQVFDAAKSVGLRPVMHGPISGSHATVGGAASQNLLGRLDSFLGFEIVLGDGRIVTTGSGAMKKLPSPHYRHYGPDLTGLFIGDTGALGIKTKVTLKLEKPPHGLAMAAFSFPSLSQMVESILAIARLNIVPRLYGMDPLKSRTATKVTIVEAGRTLSSIASGRNSLMKGLVDAATVVRAGRGALDAADWVLHVHAEGVNDDAAQASIRLIRDICCKNGLELPATVAIAYNARPYSIRGLVGIQGERFVPINAIFPYSRAAAVASRIEQFFAEHKPVFDENDISTSCIASAEQGVFLLEPMFYWADELGPIHQRHLPADKFAKLNKNKRNIDTRNVVIGLREKLRTIFFEFGASHLQIGKYYGYEKAVAPETYDLLTAIKNSFDPAGRLNPGNFGWPKKPQ
ncbi:FAD-binding oxidoreductase [Undibacter mobilis]|uniref:D-lactate dehydrogenase (cytochrome) n=1 Tax=Undibacter mobilis TaxID=2292256 RepID=A0A371B350_9BRAD|nr:FAD-binding oxidoreductase [Undibacter mobilis]RDV02009.1 FAD-binding oxidoreductase [Undibacter mobilis]